MKRFLIYSLSLCLLALAALSTFAQGDLQTRGSIKGVVTDPTGALVAGATVSVAGPTGERTATTTDDGTFEIANLTPGAYTVRVTNQGFKTTSAATTVFLGKVTNLDL